MLWRSTLFVTNFPRDMDDDGMRKLFSQVRSYSEMPANPAVRHHSSNSLAESKVCRFSEVLLYHHGVASEPSIFGALLTP